MRIIVSIVISVIAFFAVGFFLDNFTRMRPDDFVVIAGVSGFVVFLVSVYKLPATSVDKALNIQISEGRRRLRLLTTIVTTAVTYLFLVSDYGPRFSSWDYVSDKQALIGFPLLIGLCFGLSYYLITAAYWVKDGFKKENAEMPSTKNVTALELFNIADGASIEFQGKLISMAGIVEMGDEKLDHMNSVIIKGFQQPALAYTYGLTCICMLKRQKSFLQSQVANDFSRSISKRLTELSHQQLAKYIDPNSAGAKSNEYSDDQLKQIIYGVMSFFKHITSGNPEHDPLQSLNNYVSKITGLKEQQHHKEMSEAGKILLRKIEKLLG